MTYTVDTVSLAALQSLRDDGSAPSVAWPFPFIEPSWLNAWWDVFGKEWQLYSRLYRRDDEIIGIAPLMRKGDTARFIGDVDVCDYQDCIVMEGQGKTLADALLDDVRKNGISTLELGHVRPDSFVIAMLAPAAEAEGYSVTTMAEEVSVEMDLPDDYETYLKGLDSKQRHEVRRKLRRFQKPGSVVYRTVNEEESLPEGMDVFFRMFTESRHDKAQFLTEERERFFRLIVEKMAWRNMLHLGILELDSNPVATVLCFEHNESMYLYNSGYDPAYTGLSAGLVCKVMAIQEAIRKGKRIFNFLKGEETYKYHLGGHDVPLYRCGIALP